MNVARGRQQLRAVADGGHRFTAAGEVFDQRHHAGVHAQVLGAAPTGNHQAVVALGLHVGERGVEREAVAGLFAVGLRAFEIVDGGVDEVTGLLVRRDGVHRVADRLQRLKRHHGFVVLAVIAADHQQFLAHARVSWWWGVETIVGARSVAGVTARCCRHGGLP
ncbi:hypothetical protein FQZ97_1023920 [compost metagenome]